VAEWYEMVDWVQIGIQFIAVGLGAFLGFLFGMGLERTKRGKEKKDVLKATIKSLIRELEINETQLKKAGRTKEEDSFDPKMFLDSAFQSSVNTGNFYLLNITIQQQLQMLYSYIQRASKYEEWIVQLTSSLILSEGTPTQQKIKKNMDSMLDEARNLGADSISMLLAARGNLRNELRELEKKWSLKFFLSKNLEGNNS